MKRTLRIIRTLISLRLSNLMVFRLSFFGAFFADGTLFVLQIVMFNAIYAHVDTIGGWQRGQMMIFIGTFSMINAINMIVFFFGINGIPDKIHSGQMDLYITKPVHPLLRLTFENFNPGSIPLLALSFVIVARGTALQGITVSFGLAVCYELYVLVMTLLWYDLMVILRTLPFFFTRLTAVQELEGRLLDMCMTLPGRLFRGVWKLAFMLLLPYGILSTLPTELLSGVITARGALYGLAIASFFTFFTLRFFQFGLRHYKSASS